MVGHSGVMDPLPVPDLYSVLRVSPTANATDIDKAYISIAKNLPNQSHANIAYSILRNQYQRAQYDRDRLGYLQDIMKNQPEASSASSTDDYKIHSYAKDLMQRVDDPDERKKSQAIKNLADLRTEVEEYVDASMVERFDWTTSTNKVIRAAGNALCEVLVAAEEQLRELEDELGRADGLDKLEPRATVDAMPFLPSGLGARKLPSLPMSPTQRIVPQSASNIGVTIMDSDSGHGSDSNSEAATEILTHAALSRLRPIDDHTRIYLRHRATVSQPTLLREAKSMPSMNNIHNGEPIGMGLVEFQRIHGLLDPTNKENDAVFALHQLGDIPLERRRCTMPAIPTASASSTLQPKHSGADQRVEDPFQD